MSKVAADGITVVIAQSYKACNPHTDGRNILKEIVWIWIGIMLRSTISQYYWQDGGCQNPYCMFLITGDKDSVL